MRALATVVLCLGWACVIAHARAPAPFGPPLPPADTSGSPGGAAAPAASPPAPGPGPGATLVAAPGSGNTQVVETRAGSGIAIEANNPYAVVPTLGFLPILVTIRNNTPAANTWQLETTAATTAEAPARYVGQLSVTVPARTTRVFRISAPLPDFGPAPHRRVSLRVNGPGVAQPEVAWSSGSIGGLGDPRFASQTPILAGLSPAIFKAHETALTNYHQRAMQMPYLHSVLDPALLSDDWRDYLGFTTLVYTGEDWLTVPAGVRAAILRWVAAGGDLRLVSDEETLLGLPPRAGDRYGAGTIFLFRPADAIGYDFNTRRTTGNRALFNFIYRAPPGGTFPPFNAEIKAPKFTDAAPKIKQEYFWVVVTIVGFGVLVGPVNLFVFCSGPRRPRLLWVTPLLSLLASGLMVAFILLAEGIGGHGVYFRITQLAPDGKFAVESQLNASLTGLLYRREFQFPEPAWMLAVTTATSERLATGTFYQDGNRYWGDWMASRREQSEMAQAVVPSRASLRLVPASAEAPADTPPSLRSEYNGWLEEVFYLDAAGRPWKTARLGHGETVRLEPARFEEVSAAWDAHKRGAPATFTDYLNRLTPPRRSFFARGDGGESSLLPNPGGLRWKSFHHIVLGAVVE